METTVCKEKCIENKLNIYTSIQCFVSRGLAWCKLGILQFLQPGDCTQWGIQSRFLLKCSRTDDQFWVDSFIAQIVPFYSLVFSGLVSWATSCFAKHISMTVFPLKKKKQQAGPFKTQKKGFQISAPTQPVCKVQEEPRSTVRLLQSHLDANAGRPQPEATQLEFCLLWPLVDRRYPSERLWNWARPLPPRGIY